MTMAGRFQISS